MRQAVLGKGRMACQVAQSLGRETVCVPVADPPVWDTDFGEWAVAHHYPVRERYQVVRGYDLVVSVGYDKILPGDWISDQERVLNIQNAPLPRYRGMRPINWALKHGQKTHGVTIHDVVEEVDAGPIVAQVTFPLFPEDEVRDVWWRCQVFGLALWLETKPRLDVIVPVEQDEDDATYYGREMMEYLDERAGWTRQ